MTNLTNDQLTKLRHILAYAEPGMYIADVEMFDEVCAMAWRYVDGHSFQRIGPAPTEEQVIEALSRA